MAYDYDDFGVTRSIGDSTFFNEICYTGAIYDVSTGLYYLNARYYDPKNGRFITWDIYRGEINEPDNQHLYAYCANDPINYTDPSGHGKLSIIRSMVKKALKKCTLKNLYKIGKKLPKKYRKKYFKIVRKIFYYTNKIKNTAIKYGGVRGGLNFFNHMTNKLDWVNEKIEDFVYSSCRNVGMNRHWSYWTTKFVTFFVAI